MSERDPVRRIAPQGLLKRRRHEAVETTAPSQQEPSADYRARRLPVSPLPAALLPLPRGFDLTPEAAAGLADSTRDSTRRAN
ncbi:hypothetical protein [Streptomyces scopuliridis]|uniref:hypothetical protein n=1 Tax=Streptomyces scopuliridis TaxID=452529 RepID=UPI00367B4B4F